MLLFWSICACGPKDLSILRGWAPAIVVVSSWYTVPSGNTAHSRRIMVSPSVEVWSSAPLTLRASMLKRRKMAAQVPSLESLGASSNRGRGTGITTLFNLGCGKSIGASSKVIMCSGVETSLMGDRLEGSVNVMTLSP